PEPQRALRPRRGWRIRDLARSEPTERGCPRTRFRTGARSPRAGSPRTPVGSAAGAARLRRSAPAYERLTESDRAGLGDSIAPRRSRVPDPPSRCAVNDRRPGRREEKTQGRRAAEAQKSADDILSPLFRVPATLRLRVPSSSARETAPCQHRV